MKINPVIKFSYFKFLFGDSNYRINIYLILFVSLSFVYSCTNPLVEIIYGYSLNSLNEKNFHSLSKQAFSFIFVGIANLVILTISGKNSINHNILLTKKYRESYYSHILDQEYTWFNGRNLKVLSESVNNDLIKIEETVIIF